MKYISTSILCLAFVMFFSSCNKEYTCECDGTAANLGVETYTIKGQTEAEAKVTCEGYADNTNGLVTCVLK